ncbi:MAG: polysulfide reductase NrfD [Deltaproteobacteria bacterium]|nr:polysulfide reductase NrfD [Deltaproteobacteria bacterium]
MNLAPESKAQLLTPFNIVAGLILLFGGTIVVLRFAYGLSFATNLDHTTTWGLWTGFKLVFVALAASGYALTTAVYLFGMHEYHPLVRPAVLSGFMGYTLFILILIFDLGRAWRIYYPFLVQPGTTSALFEIALCVGLYYTTQFLELTPIGFEWLGWKRWRKVFIAGTVGMTVFGLLLSILHQSTLGALFLTVPGKLHPLWYSPYIPLHFFMSSAMGGISMVIIVGLICKKVFGHKMEISPEKLDKLTIGLAKGGAIALAAYFGVKLVDISIANKWEYLLTPWGMWYLLEMLGFVLLPCLLYAHGFREKKPRLIRYTALLTIIGIVLNRLNIAVVAFNWNLPLEQRYFPHWMEYVVVAFLITVGIVVFRWVAQRMPVVYDHPDYKSSH